MKTQLRANLVSCELDDDERTWLYIYAQKTMPVVDPVTFLCTRDMIREDPELFLNVVRRRFGKVQK